MSTDASPLPAPLDAKAIIDLIQNFKGNQYRYLLAYVKDPEASHAAVAHSIGILPDSAYQWRYEVPGFRDAMETIRASRRALRTEYAKLAFEEAIPDLADAMIQRGKGQGVAAQRAGERILETVGVLSKDANVSTGPVTMNVVYYTLDAQGKRVITSGVVVEATAKELPAGADKVDVQSSTESKES